MSNYWVKWSPWSSTLPAAETFCHSLGAKRAVLEQGAFSRRQGLVVEHRFLFTYRIYTQLSSLRLALKLSFWKWMFSLGNVKVTVRAVWDAGYLGSWKCEWLGCGSQTKPSLRLPDLELSLLVRSSLYLSKSVSSRWNWQPLMPWRRQSFTDPRQTNGASPHRPGKGLFPPTLWWLSLSLGASWEGMRSSVCILMSIK